MINNIIMEETDLLQHVIYKLNKYKSRYELCTDLEKKNIYAQKVGFYMKELERMEGGFIKSQKRKNLIKELLRYKKLLEDLVKANKSVFLRYYTEANYAENQKNIIDIHLISLQNPFYIENNKLEEIKSNIETNINNTLKSISILYNNKQKSVSLFTQMPSEKTQLDTIKTILEQYTKDTNRQIIELQTNFSTLIGHYY